MLVAIDKHAKGVFDPDDIRVLVAAFEDAWRSLADSGVSLMSDRDRDILRNELAKCIIEQARHGERDQRRLCDGALLHHAQLSLQSKQGKLG
jgi:hypothetical protein